MRNILIVIALFFITNLQAQNELSNFSATGRGGVVNTFATDYQAIGINPANLGIPGNTFVSFSIAEIGAGVSSQSLTRKQLAKFLSGVNEPMTQQEKLEFAAAFNNENALNANVDATSFAISVKLPTEGGFAFSHRYRLAGHIGLNQTFAEILFLGQNAPIYKNFDILNPPNVSEVFDKTKLQLSWLSEFNLAYGRTLVETLGNGLYGGVGYKYIKGIGILDLVIEDGTVRAYSSLSPAFNVNYGNLTSLPTFNYQGDKSGLAAVGTGHGFDIGLAIDINEKTKAGLSVTDLGFMEWEGNLITAFDQPLQLVTSNGISTFNLFEQIPQFTGSGDESLLSYEAEQKRKTKLPARLRAGAGLKLGEKFEGGLDVTLPLNDVAGNIPGAFVGAGIDFKPVPVVRISTGLTGGAGHGFNIPLGFTLVTPIYEAGIATRDITGFIVKENPYFSFAFGFLRFKIPKGV